MDAGQVDLVFRGLLAELRRGDAEAWRTFVGIAEPLVLKAFVRIHHPDMERAQALAMSSISKAWQSRERLPESLPATLKWIVRIGQNASISDHRKQARQVPLVTEGPVQPAAIGTPYDSAAERDSVEALRRKVQRHASPQVVADLFSNALGGKNHSEISKETGRSEQAIAKGLQRLRDEMRAEQSVTSNPEDQESAKRRVAGDERSGS